MMLGLNGGCEARQRMPVHDLDPAGSQSTDSGQVRVLRYCPAQIVPHAAKNAPVLSVTIFRHGLPEVPQRTARNADARTNRPPDESTQRRGPVDWQAGKHRHEDDEPRGFGEVRDVPLHRVNALDPSLP